ncbi:DNA repair and recombination protein rti1-like [Cotesia glomerata]|uniref:DNA repair and recombination protein rti1-like n=1 Tax=Cotesia glomerata TaxID=32391 RepID=UPI001D01E57B|nr:DNA repair and recombination protein rti1-like [Cotesia glomerata]
MSSKESIESLCLYADHVFGYDNWSHEIKSQTIDNKSRKCYIECSTIVRISFRDGRFHEGIGSYEEIDNEAGFAEIRKKSLINGNFNVLFCFQEIRTYLQSKNNERIIRLMKHEEKQRQWKLKRETEQKIGPAQEEEQKTGAEKEEQKTGAKKEEQKTGAEEEKTETLGGDEEPVGEKEKKEDRS